MKEKDSKNNYMTFLKVIVVLVILVFIFLLVRSIIIAPSEKDCEFVAGSFDIDEDGVATVNNDCDWTKEDRLGISLLFMIFFSILFIR